VGGVVGIVIEGTVTNSDSTGTVSGDEVVGGVVGHVGGFGEGIVTNCYSMGMVRGKFGIGGVAGNVGAAYVDGPGMVYGGKGVVTHSYSVGTVNGENSVGGVAGYVDNGIITNCYSVGTVSGKNSVGGVAGSIWDNGSVKNCAALNPGVKGNNVATAGRVVGYQGVSTRNAVAEGDDDDDEAVEQKTFEDPPIPSGVILNNVAFFGLTNRYSHTDWPNKSAELRDGANITAVEITTDGTIGGRFKAEDGWTTQNGKLPGLLGSAVNMPSYLK
jgi:hypothetical protein